MWGQEIFTEVGRNWQKREPALWQILHPPEIIVGIPSIFHLSWLATIGRENFLSGKLEANLSVEIHVLVSVTHNYVFFWVSGKKIGLALKECKYVNS